MTIKEKILSFLNSEGIKKTEFYETVGLVPSNFKGAAKQSELGGDKIAKILTSYPRLSAEWLFRDEGEMIKITTTAEEPAADSQQETNAGLLNKVIEQAEEIGRLKERVEQLESAMDDTHTPRTYENTPCQKAAESSSSYGAAEYTSSTQKRSPAAT